jgi:ABC-2 type transport system permease protein
MAATTTGPTPVSGVGAWMGVLRAVVVKELTVLSRYPLEFVATFAQVFLMVAVFTMAGLMFAPRGTPGGEVTVLGGTLVYGFVIFLFFIETVSTVGDSLRRERKQGTLEQLYISPAPPTASLVARVAVILVWTGVLALLSVVLMGFMIGELPARNVGVAGVVLLFTVSGIFGIGFGFAGFTLWIRESAQMFTSFAQFGFMILCAPFFPFSVLPEWLKQVASVVPLAHSVDLFRSALMGFPGGYPELAPAPVGFAVVVGFGLLAPPIGIWYYRRCEEWARLKGYLAEY